MTLGTTSGSKKVLLHVIGARPRSVSETCQGLTDIMRDAVR